MRIQTRTLPPEEVQRAIDAGGPLQDLQVQADKLQEMSVAVVEVDGEIAAYWVAWYALHLEPLWIHPLWRKHPGVIGGIVGEIQKIAEASGEPAGFCVIEADDLALVGSYATRLGFQEAPGKLFYVVLEPAVEPVEV